MWAMERAGNKPLDWFVVDGLAKRYVSRAWWDHNQELCIQIDLFEDGPITPASFNEEMAEMVFVLAKLRDQRPSTEPVRIKEKDAPLPQSPPLKVQVRSLEDTPGMEPLFHLPLTKPTNPKQAFGDKKPPLWCVPVTVIWQMALGMYEGALKYDPFNWRETKVEAMTYVAAAKRHLDMWTEGQEMDPDTGNTIDHLTKAMCSIAVLLDAKITGNMIDNRPTPAPEGWDAHMQDVIKTLREKYPPK